MPRERLFAAAACGLFAIIVTFAAEQAQAGSGSGRSEPSSQVARHPAGLPPHLGARDVALYRQIFTLQDGAAWAQAECESQCNCEPAAQ